MTTDNQRPGGAAFLGKLITTDVYRFLRKRPYLIAIAVLAAGPAGLIMHQASNLLAAAQSEGRSAYTMSALNSPSLGDGQLVDALNVWTVAGIQGEIGGLIRSWLYWHLWADLLIWAPATFLVMLWGMSKAFPHAGADESVPLGVAVLPWLYFGSDEAENLISLLLTSDVATADQTFVSSGLTHTLTVLTWVKWLVGIGAVVAIILCWMLVSSGHPGRRLAASLRLAWVLRVQVIVVAMLALAVAVPAGGPLEQFPDILRSANDGGPWSSSVILPALALVAMSAALWGSGGLIIDALMKKVLLNTALEPQADGVADNDARALRTETVWLLVAAGIAAAVAGLIWLVTHESTYPSPAIWAPAGILVLLTGVNWFVWYVDEQTPEPLAERVLWGEAHLWTGEEVVQVRALLIALTVSPLTVIAGMGAAHAYVPELLLTGDRGAGELMQTWPFWWVAAGFVIVVIGTPVAFVKASQRRLPEPWPLTLAMGVLLLTVGVLTAVAPDEVGRRLYGHGTITLWLALLAVLAGVVQWLAEDKSSLLFAGRLGFERTPWFAIGIIWIVFTASSSGDGYHAATTMAGDPDPVGVEEALEQWYADALDCRGLTEASGRNEVVPFVLVAAPGGGARAAYWTGITLAGVSRGDECSGGSVFAASGVSGGSMGLAAWGSTPAEDIDSEIQELTGPDPLSANLAAMMFRDIPMSLAGLNPVAGDRASVTEKVWIEKVSGLGDDFFAAPADDASWDPILLLNGSDLASGCKVLVSRLSLVEGLAPLTDPDSETVGCKATPEASAGRPVPALGAGALAAHTFLADNPDCNGDNNNATATLSFATAAHLSARFPFVSPTGRLFRCGSSGEVLEQLYVADGGYLENTGIHSLLGMWSDIRPWIESKNQAGGPMIVPLAVLVDNHYRSPAKAEPGAKLNELSAPQQGLGGLRRSLLGTEALEQELAAAFTGPIPGVAGDSDTGDDALRWFVIAPVTRPQLAAPLGWSLSNQAQRSMRCQLDPALQPTGVDLADCPAAAEESPIINDLIGWLSGDVPG